MILFRSFPWNGLAARKIAIIAVMLPVLAGLAQAQPPPQSDAQFLTADFQVVLGRLPDPTGFAYWFQYLPNTLTRDQVSQDLLGSPEYCSFFSLNPGCANPPTDDDFLTHVYWTALHRMPDSTGWNFWLYCQLEPGSGQCTAGAPASPALTRAQVVDSFAGTQELKDIYHAGVQVTPKSIAIQGTGASGATQTVSVVYEATQQQMNEIGAGQVFIGAGSPNNYQNSLANGCYIEWWPDHATMWNGSGWSTGSFGSNTPMDGAYCSLHLQQSYYTAGTGTITLALTYANPANAAGTQPVWSFGLNAETWPTLPWTGPALYSFTTNTSGAGTISPPSGWYSGGSSVRVMATPGNGYRFSNFTGALNGSTDPQFLTVSQAASVTATFVPAASTNLFDLQTCLNDATKTDCSLAVANSPYMVSTTIQLSRPNVTLRSESTTTNALLVRGAGFIGPMIRVNLLNSTGTTGVLLQNLTVCGNNNLRRDPGLPSSGCPLRPDSYGDGSLPYDKTRTPKTGNDCNAYLWNLTYVDPFSVSWPGCDDLKIEKADTGANPALNDQDLTFRPMNTPYPSYSIEVSRCHFEDSTGNAISMYPSGPNTVNDVYIHETAINSSAVTGIIYGANPATPAINYADHNFCDHFTGSFRDDVSSVFLPRNIRIEWNTFQGNNTGAMGGGARWVGLRNNTFTNNYINPQVGNTAGGTVEFDPCSDTIQIYKNQMTGPSYANTSGLELWGRNLNIQTNTISGYANEGIGLNSVYNASILGFPAEIPINRNLLQNNDTNAVRSQPFYTGGILVQDRGGPGCDPDPRDTQTVTISGNTSTGQAFGIDLGYAGDGTGILNGLTLSQNNLSSNSQYPVWQNPMVWLNQASFDTSDQPFLGDTAPHPGYGTDPIPSAVSINPKCPSSPPSSNRQTFTFQAVDNLGWQHVQSIEVQFGGSASGPDSGANGCRFFFANGAPANGVPSGTIYLDSLSGGYTYNSSSAVGAGNDLQNDSASPTCLIHAGTSQVTSIGTNLLKLSLDLEFRGALRGTTRYMYMIVENDRNNFSQFGSSWSYFGSWIIP